MEYMEENCEAIVGAAGLSEKRTCGCEQCRV